MNYQESREYIDKITREIPSVLGLDHMRELMKRLGNPQDDLKYVHVAGTNGKGSVIAFLYSVLSGAGYRIGRYVSPTLYSYRGRMEVSGSRISRASLLFPPYSVKELLSRDLPSIHLDPLKSDHKFCQQ